MRKHILCGHLFTGADAPSGQTRDQIIVVDGDAIAYVGPAGDAPARDAADAVLDYSKYFVMPGLIDVHVHLSYGDAMTEEDMDLYASHEYRALRGVVAAQRMLRAGYTAIADPATTGRVTPSIRDAINVGLFKGPRITSAGRQLTTHQGLSDWYPSWIGVPDSAIGVLVRNIDEAIEEIRLQVKDGVDLIKIAMDGDTMNPSTGLIAGFNQQETTAMVTEAQRLGKKVVVHARGAEGVLYSACAGADLILHASWMTDEGLDAVVKNGCRLCPTFGLIVNNIEFSQPTDASHAWWPDLHRAELDAAVSALSKARAAGVEFLIGSDTGFAITPYGEWNARELRHMVDLLGFSPAEALTAATAKNGAFLREAGRIGVLETGRLADILVVDGDPLADIAVLQDRGRLVEILLGGEPVRLDLNDRAGRTPAEQSYNLWSDIYTQERVRELGPAIGSLGLDRAAE